MVCDFDCEIYLYYYLAKDDPVYDEYSDNIMTILTTNEKDLKWNWGLGDNKCHNTTPSRKGTPWEHEKHCSLYHDLYDHTALSYREILRIGTFELDMDLCFEYGEEELWVE